MSKITKEEIEDYILELLNVFTVLERANLLNKVDVKFFSAHMRYNDIESIADKMAEENKLLSFSLVRSYPARTLKFYHCAVSAIVFATK